MRANGGTILGYPVTGEGIQALIEDVWVSESTRRVPVKKPMFSATNLIATAGVLLFGYVFFASLPDLRRYIRISTM